MKHNYKGCVTNQIEPEQQTVDIIESPASVS